MAYGPITLLTIRHDRAESSYNLFARSVSRIVGSLPVSVYQPRNRTEIKIV